MPMLMSQTGRRRGSVGRWSPIADINVTPFVDVMLVLLIVFMVAAPLLTVGVPLELPRGPARPLPTDLAEPLTIHIDASGQIFIQSAEIADADLVPKLTAIGEERGRGRVYVRADSSIPYGRAMLVLGALNASGFQDFGLVMASDAVPLTAPVMERP